ncbi:hypothetical protein [Mesorhizobium sp. M0011]|uniref:hypothetical protein n=1 Tax=Mesorhizobium sp. M0011 TaxID=2956839 RepID=UPI00333DF50D
MAVTPHPEPAAQAEEEPFKRKPRKSPRKPRGPLTEGKIDELTVSYLSLFISAHLKRHPYPDIPLEIRSILQDEIDDAGGLIAWAKNHPSFSRLKDIKMAARMSKTQKYMVVKVGKRDVVVGAERTEVAKREQLDALIAERKRLGAALEEAVELIRKTRVKIKHLDLDIAELQLR